MYGGARTNVSTDAAVKWYFTNGATAGKINMGIPLSGHAFEDTTGLGHPYNGVSTLSFYPQSDIYHYSPQDRAKYNPGRNLLVFGLPGSAMQSQYLVLHSRTPPGVLTFVE